MAEQSNFDKIVTEVGGNKLLARLRLEQAQRNRHLGDIEPDALDAYASGEREVPFGLLRAAMNDIEKHPEIDQKLLVSYALEQSVGPDANIFDDPKAERQAMANLSMTLGVPADTIRGYMNGTEKLPPASRELMERDVPAEQKYKHNGNVQDALALDRLRGQTYVGHMKMKNGESITVAFDSVSYDPDKSPYAFAQRQDGTVFAFKPDAVDIMSVSVLQNNKFDTHPMIGIAEAQAPKVLSNQIMFENSGEKGSFDNVSDMSEADLTKLVSGEPVGNHSSPDTMTIGRGARHLLEEAMENNAEKAQAVKFDGIQKEPGKIAELSGHSHSHSPSPM